MTFEFHGADLETPDGIELYKYFYKMVAGGDSAEPFIEAPYAEWAKSAPDEAGSFLTSLVEDESPAVRSLAGKLAFTYFTRTHPDLAVDVMTTVIQDEDRVARGTLPEFVEESFTDSTFDEWIEDLGLPRMRRLHEVVLARKPNRRRKSSET